MQEYLIYSCTPMYRFISLRNAGDSTSKLTIGMIIVNIVIMVPILLLPITAAIIMVILVIVVVSVVVVTIPISVGMISFVWAVPVVPVSRRGRPGASRQTGSAAPRSEGFQPRSRCCRCSLPRQPPPQGRPRRSPLREATRLRRSSRSSQRNRLSKTLTSCGHLRY